MATPAQRRTGLPVGSRSSHTLQVGLCSGYVAHPKHELIAVSFPCRMATIWRWLEPDHEAVAGEVQACLRRPNGLDLKPRRTVLTQPERNLPQSLRPPTSLTGAIVTALASC